MTTKPEALRIAEAFERLAIDHAPDGYPAVRLSELNAAAAELRRLYVELEALRKPAVEPAGSVIAWRLNGVSELGHGVVKGAWIDGAPSAQQIDDICKSAPDFSLEYAYKAPQAQQPAPVQRPAEQWCYSTDQERYHGNCATEAEAHAEAIQELENDVESGETCTYWIAQVAPAWEKLDAVRVGEWCEEHLDENLADEIGWDDNIVELTQPEREKLGQMVIDYVRSVDGFRAYGVKGQTEHQHTIGSEGGAA